MVDVFLWPPLSGGAPHARMTELEHQSIVLTFDSDFKIYRRNKRQNIPTLTPH